MVFRRRRRAAAPARPARDLQQDLADEDGGSFDSRAPEYRATFARFLRQCYASELRQLRASLSATSAPGARPVLLPSYDQQQQQQQQQQSFAYSLRADAQRLLDASPSLASLLFRHPDQLLPLFHAALADEVANSSASGLAPVASAVSVPLRARQKLKVRVEHLPPVGGLRKPGISAVRSNDVKQLIQIAGTVVRTGMIKMQETSREYQCSSARCGYRFLVQSDPEQGNILEIPKVCPSESGGKPCRSTQFDVVDGSQVVSDHQVIKIQEQASKLGVGSIPRSILVVLEDDLVDSVKAGDQVVVVGILMRCWQPCIRGVRCDLETTIRANSIRIKNATSAHVLVTEELKNEFAQFWKFHSADPMRGRNEIIASICPKVYGLFIVKLGIALTVIGGCSHVDETGMKTRGEPHMLLIGDPGTGKSQFLRFTAELSPRSVLTTGIGTTSAGLTCTAVKDGSEWMLEAGALVLADRGICCIDEFSSIRSNDRTSIHEAMEQQTLSVAKAGLVCKLNARTTIFAVTNPKGRYDPNADVSVNTSIASPLLSRFDLILVLLDRMNPSWDHVVSSFILKQSTARDDDGGDVKDEYSHEDEVDVEHPSFDLLGSQRGRQPSQAAASQHSQRGSNATTPMKGKMADELLWSIPKLQAYICYVKDKYQPQLSRGAMLILQRYYQVQRASDSRSAARTTIRLLESLTRLSQAHARLMCHEEVVVTDAVVAVFIMEVSKATDSYSELLGGGLESVLHSDFAEDPAAEYALQEKLVLEYIGLSDLATTTPSTGHSQRSARGASSSYSRGNYAATRSSYEEVEADVPTSNEVGFPPPRRAAAGNPGVKRWARYNSEEEQRASQRPRRDEWGGSQAASGHLPPRTTSQPMAWSSSQRSALVQDSQYGGEADGDEEEAFANDTYYQNRHLVADDAPPASQASLASEVGKPRFDFGRWSQQAEAHQSVTSRWRSQA